VEGPCVFTGFSFLIRPFRYAAYFHDTTLDQQLSYPSEACPIVSLLNQKAADFKVCTNGDPSPPGQDPSDFEHPLPPDYSEEQNQPALLYIEGERRIEQLAGAPSP
jgi:hypothetical protein